MGRRRWLQRERSDVERVGLDLGNVDGEPRVRFTLTGVQEPTRRPHGFVVSEAPILSIDCTFSGLSQRRIWLIPEDTGSWFYFSSEKHDE